MPVPHEPRGVETAAASRRGTAAPETGTLPYWRLSSFYFFFFAVLGALLPYWSLYLKSLGFRPLEVGAAFGVMMATKIIAPNIWGWLGDRTGRRMAIVRWAAVLAAAAFSGTLFGSHFWWLITVVAVFSFFWNATLPQFEAVTLNHLGKKSFSYSRIRLWGSVGFIASVYVVGFALDVVELGALPWIVLLLVAGIALASLAVAEPADDGARRATHSLMSVIGRPTVLALLAACFLMQASHGPYYDFFTIQMETVGHSRQLIGGLWSLGVLAEVVLFLFMHRLMPRFGLRALFLASFAATALRWILLAFYADILWVVLASQLLHAATFGIYHAVAIQLVHGYFVERHQGRGQALYSSVSFGAGGAAGSFLSGYAWEAFGPQVTWLGASAASAVAALVVWRWLDDPMRPRGVRAGAR
ncbi:MAG: MFS transporter [Gammaproteobacteria bacterium]|nr:MFS transporter [Gammaproteobacteria bacterium]